MKKNINEKRITLNENTSKLTKFGHFCVIFLVSILCFLIAFLAIKITVYFKTTIDFAGESSYYKLENMPLNILFTIATFLLIYIIYKIANKINNKIILALMLVVTVVSGMGWINLIKLRPLNDQKQVKLCAEAILEDRAGDVLSPGMYLNQHPHQLGFVLYLTALFKILGSRANLIPQTLNVLYSALNGIIIYLICKRMFKEEKVHKLCLLFITFFAVYWAFFDTHIYGNIPGLTFSLLGVYFTCRYLDNNKFYNLPIIGVMLTLAFLLKSNFIIFFIAIAIIILLNIINTRKAIDLLGILAIVLIIFGSKSIVYNIAEEKLGYTFSEGVPMSSYIYMGMAEPNTLPPGWYNKIILDVYAQHDFDKEESAKEISDRIDARVDYLSENPDYTLDYFSQKFQTTWLNPTFQTIWCSTPSTELENDLAEKARVVSSRLINSILCGELGIVLERIMNMFEIVIFLSAGVSLITILRKYDLKLLILPLTFLGGLLFHMIWETKSIYVIQYFFILIPISAYGMNLIFEWAESLVKLLKNADTKNIIPNKNVGIKVGATIALCLITLVSVNTLAKDPNEVIPLVDESNIELKANFIWNNCNDKNTWVMMRKKVTLSKEEAKSVVAQIGADSKYWLYINGELVIRDGNLKRSVVPKSTYYDEVDLTKYFKEGENTIAILGWFWKGGSFSHVSSGQAGVFFQAKVGDNWIITDDTWKVKQHEGYKYDEVKPNYRLMEHNVYYDSRFIDENWYEVDFDDSTWENAKVLNVIGSKPWRTLIKRDIPMFKDGELKEYENMAEYKDYTTTESKILEMKIPYNAQFTPYLKIEAKEGIEINIYTDAYHDVIGDTLRFSYVTKNGIQEFESPEWLNGETVYYNVPAGVKIISLGYRETGYDTEFAGDFTSDDEFLNELWTKSRRTLYVNMRDTYMGSPNRERAQWLGDMNIEMMEAMYSLDTNANALYEKGIKTVLGWSQNDILYAVSPNNLEQMHIPVQSLAGIVAMQEYYEYTGNKDFIEMVYPYVKKYLNLWRIDNDTNLIIWNEYTAGQEWGDSKGNTDYRAIENAWYYYATTKAIDMAKVLGKLQDVKIYKAKLKDVGKGIESLWTEKGYKTKDCEFVDERVNAVLVLAGFVKEDKYSVMKEIFEKNYQATPYMEKYVLEAMCKMGEYEASQERMKSRYSDMVNGENACSTLWEQWNIEEGTKNQGWSGGPLIIMSKYYAGIEPLKPGYEEVLVKPNFGSLKTINAKVETIKGKIEMNAKLEDDVFEMNLETPSKTLIGIPKIKDNIVKINDKEVGKPEKEDEDYIYYYVNSGKMQVKSEKIN